MLEERVVLKVLELYTITAAFENLKERLDPEEHIFEPAERFWTMLCARGNSLQTFYTVS